MAKSLNYTYYMVNKLDYTEGFAEIFASAPLLLLLTTFIFVPSQIAPWKSH